jgi:hypothetical protein
MPNRGQLADSFPTDGGRSGSDYELMREQLLDRYDYSHALLTHNLGDVATHLNPYFAAAACSAVNDWNVAEWLDRDERLSSVVLAAPQLPAEADAEIRRVGSHSRMAGVLFSGNPLGRPLGDPVFDVLHRAAADLDLPIVVHVANSDRPTTQIRTVGGNKPTTMEGVAESGQCCAHYISSLIVHGVFERYPNLKVLFNEYGVSWLPTILWRLDENYQLMRLESSWVRRWPSEYVADHVRFSTQPFEQSSDDRQAMARLLATVDGVEDLLCFSSDYPHISFDKPSAVMGLLPTAWHRKIFCDNARLLFGWRDAAVGTSSGGEVDAKVGASSD